MLVCTSEYVGQEHGLEGSGVCSECRFELCGEIRLRAELVVCVEGGGGVAVRGQRGVAADFEGDGAGVEEPGGAGAGGGDRVGGAAGDEGGDFVAKGGAGGEGGRAGVAEFGEEAVEHGEADFEVD